MWGKVGAQLATGIASQIGVRLVLDNAGFAKSFDKTMNTAEKKINQTSGKTQSAWTGAMGKVGVAIAAAFSIKAIIDFSKSAVNAASQTQAAWTGLNSILTGTGKSFAEGQEFIKSYISDGLVPLQNAVTSYKNLAARGYSTEQIEQTMTALKDAAAFGRQASYSYGEAIQTATEGLKNENSILVDNAGVNKSCPLVKRFISALTRISVKIQRWTRPTRQLQCNAC